MASLFKIELQVSTNFFGQTSYVQYFSVIIYFSFQLQCCGLISGYDIYDFTTVTRGYYPITCCRRTLYDTTENQIYYSSEIFGQNCDLIQTVSKILS